MEGYTGVLTCCIIDHGMEDKRAYNNSDKGW